MLAGPPLHKLARPKDAADPDTQHRIRHARRFAALAKRSGGITRLAYRFALTHPGVSTVLGGFSSPAQIDDAVAAATAGPLDPDVMTAIEAARRSDFLG